eukprot:COSAG05_NODE_1262_length_5337_cov_612.892728_3_plen_71_part_00
MRRSGRVRRLLLALVAAIDASRGELSSHVWVWGALHSACLSFLRVNAGGTDLGRENQRYGFSKNTPRLLY